MGKTSDEDDDDKKSHGSQAEPRERPDPCTDDERAERNALVKRIWDAVEKIPDPAVADRVRELLYEAFTREGKHTLGERLMAAYARSDEARLDKSTDPVARDVEYFMLGLSSGVNREASMIAYTQLTGAGYDALKELAHALKDLDQPGLEYALRANKDQPTSRPGRGPERAREGLMLGYRLDANRPFCVSRRELERPVERNRKP